MTGFIVAPYRDRVEILSDGAQYTSDGVVIGAAYKVIQSDVIPLAMVGSGVVSEIALLADAVLAIARNAKSVDRTLAVLSDRLADVAFALNPAARLRLAIGAVSETRGPRCFTFATFVDPASSLGAFELREMTRCFAQGAAPRGDDLLAYGPLDISKGLERDAVFMMGSMRRQKMPSPVNPDREPFHSVGCHVDLTTVRAIGCTTRRLHVWPEDVIGRPIAPN